MNKICGHFIKIISKHKDYSACVALGRHLSFKSDLSLDKIYPTSNLKIYTPAPPQSKDEKQFTGYIPMNEIEITYSRSSGPGGQNVNCVNTKVDVRFNVEKSTWIPEQAKKRLLDEHSTKITKDGYYVVKSDVTRSQQMNLADALEKIRCAIREFEKPKQAAPTEDTIEKIRRRHERAARERLLEKRHRSLTKSERQSPSVNL